MDTYAEAVERRVVNGYISPLTQDTWAADLEGLREDLLNWDHGHALGAGPVEEVAG